VEKIGLSLKWKSDGVTDDASDDDDDDDDGDDDELACVKWTEFKQEWSRLGWRKEFGSLLLLLNIP